MILLISGENGNQVLLLNDTFQELVQNFLLKGELVVKFEWHL